MPWLLAIAAIVALVTFAKKEGDADDSGGGKVIPPPPPAPLGDANIVRVEADSFLQSALGWDTGGWAWVPLDEDRDRPSPWTEPAAYRGPFTTAGEARASLLEAGYREVAGEGTQGTTPPAIPVVAYLRVSAPPVSGSATAGPTGVTWRKTGGAGGDVQGEAAIVATANAQLLAAVHAAAAPAATVTISLRRGDGAVVRAVVWQVNLQTWQWRIITPPIVEGDAGVSVTNPSWRTLDRLSAMRRALVQIQGGA